MLVKLCLLRLYLASYGEIWFILKQDTISLSKTQKNKTWS